MKDKETCWILIGLPKTWENDVRQVIKEYLSKARSSKEEAKK